jgi:hypothetical protein
MRSPKPAKEDPNVVAAREREQRRAETARTEETQAYLQGATIRRNRRFGKVGAGGSVPIYGGVNLGNRGFSGGGSGGSGSGGGSFGDGNAPGRGSMLTDAVIY